MTTDRLEIYEFPYAKYGEHVVALRIKGKGGVQLFDTVKLFAERPTMGEYERVKGEAADLAKQFVAQFNQPALLPVDCTKEEMLAAWEEFKTSRLHSVLCGHLAGTVLGKDIEGTAWGFFYNGFMAGRKPAAVANG